MRTDGRRSGDSLFRGARATTPANVTSLLDDVEKRISIESGSAARCSLDSVSSLPVRDAPLPVDALVGQLQVVLPGTALA